MNEKLRAAAAERLRSVDDRQRDIVFPSPILLIADWETLARAYLAEHPADDGEPVTEETFAKLPGSSRHQVSEGHPAAYYLGLGAVNVVLTIRQTIYFTAFDTENRIELRNPTWGQVRSACRALGSPLTERAAP